jgi:hypothetical protein
MLERLRRLLGGGGRTAARQEGDPTVLNRSDEPRGGTQSDEYRHAGPTDVTEQGGTVMAGPGGAAPVEDSPDERRERDREGFGPGAQRGEPDENLRP